jgi:hypothetical protein
MGGWARNAQGVPGRGVRRRTGRMSLRAAVSDTWRLFRRLETSFSAVLAVGSTTADAPLAFPGPCSPVSVRFPCRCPGCSQDCTTTIIFPGDDD